MQINAINIYNNTRSKKTSTFGSAAPYADPLRKLIKFGIPDMYSPVTILDSDISNSILNRKVFSTNIQRIAKELQSIENSLFNIEWHFFNMLRDFATKKPDFSIQQFIGKEVRTHNKRLRDIEDPILRTVENMAYELPGDLLEQFDYLNYITKRKLAREPVFIPFSIKELVYKLKNIRKRIKGSTNSFEEISAINKLISIASSIPDIPKEIRLSRDFKINRYEYKQKKMFDKFCEFIYSSVLNKDTAIIDTMITFQNRIDKKPAVIPFNRKSYIHELDKILEPIKDTHLAHLMIKEAISLPTSKKNISAFIVKASERSTEQIGFDILDGSTGSVDHLIAAAKGGNSSMFNYGMTTRYKNSEKSDKSMPVWIREEPLIPLYAQLQIDRLIELANAGIFRKVGLDKKYIDYHAKNLEKLSKNPNITFDIHALE